MKDVLNPLENTTQRGFVRDQNVGKAVSVECFRIRLNWSWLV
jgi:hypothetical protein